MKLWIILRRVVTLIILTLQSMSLLHFHNFWLSIISAIYVAFSIQFNAIVNAVLNLIFNYLFINQNIFAFLMLTHNPTALLNSLISFTSLWGR